MDMPETRRKHPRDFKLAAVRIVEQGGKSRPEIERDLGMGRSQVCRWLDQLRADGPWRSLETGTHGTGACVTSEGVEGGHRRTRDSANSNSGHLLTSKEMKFDFISQHSEAHNVKLIDVSRNGCYALCGRRREASCGT